MPRALLTTSLARCSSGRSNVFSIANILNSYRKLYNMTPTNSPAAVDLESVKEVVAEHIGVPVDVSALDPQRDLYQAGLTSLATVGLMLALEERFDIEFPESMLSRGTFRTIASISEAVAKLAR
jgi:acyl carrier protein